MKKCRPAWVVMSQTKLAATALDESTNDNLSVPYGLIRTVRHYLEFVGVLSYIRGLKSKGVRLTAKGGNRSVGVEGTEKKASFSTPS